MKIRRFALTLGLGLSLIATSYFSACRKNVAIDYSETVPVEKIAESSGPFSKVYYKNLDFDDELEKIIITSKPFRHGRTEDRWNYTNRVQIYIKRAETIERNMLVGRERIIIGENAYHLKREFRWRGSPIKEKDIIFGAKILNVQGKEIIYDNKTKTFHFLKDLEKIKK